MNESWSTEQLTEFVVAISGQTSVCDATSAAAERSAELLDAEVGAFLQGGAVLSSVGFDTPETAARVLLPALDDEFATVEVDGAGRCEVAASHLPDNAGTLLVARSGEAFAAAELHLLRGMARVLAIVLAKLALHESEQAHVAEKQLLAASLRQRALLLEQITRLQGEISRGAHLEDVLDTIVDGAAALLGVEIANLKFVDENDPAFMLLVASTQFRDSETTRTMRRAPITEGASGRAIATGELVVIEDYERTHEPSRLAPRGMSAALAVPLFEHGTIVGSVLVASDEPGKRWDASERELLSAYADHASLMLAAARRADQMRHAFTDSLTGLANRSLFLDRLEHHLNRADQDGEPVSVLFLDLDGFKLVNDTLGHLVGDELLVQVAERLLACVRASDTCARLGGDEFAVIVGPGSQAEHLAERIIGAMRPVFELDGRSVFVSASIGIASGVGEAETLLRNADVAMYRAKGLGKGRSARFEQAMHDDLVKRLELDADLRRALDDDEFELHYQPIFDLASGEVTLVEALIRWRHPQRGLVPPLDFIPIAEETGFIHRIGQWVIREACAQAARWQRDLGRPIAVSVNLSGRELQDAVVERIAMELRRSRIAPDSLVVEITETVLMHDTDATIDILRRLKGLGVRIAIDDFGTGYSSLRYLSRFPADILKIAKPFVDAIGGGGRDARLTGAIVELGTILDLVTVGEGIEEGSQEQELRALGCSLGQGYLFARPLPVADVEAVLRSGLQRAA